MRKPMILVTVTLLVFNLIAGLSLSADQTIRQADLDETLRNATVAAEAGNYDQAFELFEQAARWGHKGAQFVLGELHLKGIGTPRDEIAGLAWLHAAAESEKSAYVQARDRAAYDLTEAETHQAHSLYSEIAAAYGLDAAQVKCKPRKPPGSNFFTTTCRHRSAGAGRIHIPDPKL